MKKTVVILIVILCPTLLFSQITGIIKKVYSGDMFTLKSDGGEKIKVRLCEIDCPESSQPYGDNATNFMLEYLYKSVRIEIKGEDGDGNVLAMVFYQDENLNELLLKNGLAWHNKNNTVSQKLVDLETAAKKEKKGLWEEDDPISPWEWRRIQH